MPVAAQLELAAEQAGQLAADGEAGPVPPHLRLVLASARWNASKMMRQARGMPMPVSDTRATTRAAWLRSAMPRRPRPLGDVQPHAALGGELEGVREQVLEDLLQALRVGDHRRPEARFDGTSNDRPRSRRRLNVRTTRSSRLVK
jgi:hypothetical protein